MTTKLCESASIFRGSHLPCYRRCFLSIWPDGNSCTSSRALHPFKSRWNRAEKLGVHNVYTCNLCIAVGSEGSENFNMREDFRQGQNGCINTVEHWQHFDTFCLDTAGAVRLWFLSWKWMWPNSNGQIITVFYFLSSKRLWKLKGQLRSSQSTSRPNGNVINKYKRHRQRVKKTKSSVALNGHVTDMQRHKHEAVHNRTDLSHIFTKYTCHPKSLGWDLSRKEAEEEETIVSCMYYSVA